MEVGTIRGTNLDTFKRCPMAYRLGVHEKRVPDIKIHPWASLGWIMHLTCEQCMLDINKDPFEQFTENIKNQNQVCLNEWNQGWKDVPLPCVEIPELTPRQIERGYIMTKKFTDFRKNILKKNPKIECERAFEIFIDKEKTMPFRGRIDVVLKFDDGTCWILDYKSSNKNYAHKVVPPQLERYGIAISVSDKIPISSIKGVIFNLEAGQLIERQFSKETSAPLLKDMIDTITDIKACSPENANAVQGNYCFSLCSYRKTCYKIQNGYGV